ncbi:hypothetical protein NE237_020231 [Protea cynaroides]|uniref:NB-ARC domain-containing protein n=1 Tax=Protea cynaroides TaxID=273540 RepID=A0A9Q0H5L0_9MAGN|nr:hypothetical protein NE237_020231 [Protea cynaroides]
MNRNLGLSINRATLDKENIQQVIEWLLDGSVYFIVLKGDLRKVRTWTSGPLQDCIAKCMRISCYQVLWINVSGCNVREMQLQILEQLKVIPGIESYQEEESVARLRQKICTSLDHKCFLLILDDIQSPHQFPLHDVFGYPPGSVYKVLYLAEQWIFPVSMSASYIRFLDLDYLFIDCKDLPQVPIVPSQEVPTPIKKACFQGLKQNKKKIMEHNGMSFDEAWDLFLQNSREAVDSLDIRPLAEAVVLQCLGNTSEICWAAGALRNRRGYTIQILTAALEKAREPGLRLNMFNILDELCYKMLPSKAIKDCFLYCKLYPENHEFNVKELITSWIMEGFLEGFNCLEEAYEGGHHVLEQLIDHHLLDKRGGHHVKLPLFIRRDLNHLQTNKGYITRDKSFRIFTRAGLRLTICHLWNKASLQKICLMDENFQIRYPNIPESHEPSTLLLYGNRRSQSPVEFSNEFFRKFKSLQVLALVQMGVGSLPLFLCNLPELRVLVLKKFCSLKKLNHMHWFPNLTVLSLSGASALKEIPDDFLLSMTCLQVLDLSETQIERLPSSLSQIFSLRNLILRGCSRLTLLPQLMYLTALEVLDLSGATILREIHKNFGSKNSLHLLDFSRTLIQQLPAMYNLSCIRYLLLKGCPNLEVLPALDKLHNLKVLDLSGATNFKGFINVDFGPMDHLQKLDLSGTQVAWLPFLAKCANLHKLLLRGCPKLEILLHLEALTTLEVLDLSGSIAFKEFQLGSFGQKNNLRVLDLRGTQVVNLPILSECRNLHQLLLGGCSKLEKLPDLKALTRLEVLDLSGTKNLRGFQDETFGQMDDLQILNLSATKIENLQKLEALTKLEVLDLSETQIVRVPSLIKSSGIRQLLLQGCSRLVALPPVEGLRTLEVFDISGATALTEIPNDYFEGMDQLKILNLSELLISQLPSSISNLRNLNQLLLRGCSNLEMLPCLEALRGLEVLDLLGTRIKRFPIGFMKSAHLKRLYILNLMRQHGLDNEDVMQVLKDLKWI